VRLIALIAPVVSLMSASFGFGRWWGRRRSNPDPEMERLREATDLARAASRAHRRGRHGEANILAEASKRIFESLDDDPPGAPR
jgi:hypothetical protein